MSTRTRRFALAAICGLIALSLRGVAVGVAPTVTLGLASSNHSDRTTVLPMGTFVSPNLTTPSGHTMVVFRARADAGTYLVQFMFISVPRALGTSSFTPTKTMYAGAGWDVTTAPNGTPAHIFVEAIDTEGNPTTVERDVVLQR